MKTKQKRSALRKKPYETDEITDEIQDNKYGVNPEFSVVDKVRAGELMEIISLHLSKKELKVFEGYLSGKSYEKISKELMMTTKNVDNAMQRVRKKLKAVLDNENSN